MIFLILENIRSLYNLGSIFRTADAFNIKKIFLIGHTGILIPNHIQDNREAVLNPKIEKTALGAQNFIKWQHFWTTKEAINHLRKTNPQIHFVALEQTKKSISFTQAKYYFPLALIVGNEKSGVKKETLKTTNQIIEIPMLGKKKSLNVSIACALALCEVTKSSRNCAFYR